LTARNTVRLLAAAALVLTLAGSLAAADAKPFARTLIPADGTTIRKIAKLRTETNHWRTVMGLRSLRHEHATRELAGVGSEYRHWVLRLWRKRAETTRRRAQSPPHLRSWLCIHRYERNPSQGWRTNTGNGYYGGLQMDISFQRAYGGRLLRAKGTADRWTPLEQIWVAVKAYRSGRGFHPWPNTARACGLL
jgi:hypothetical protein